MVHHVDVYNPDGGSWLCLESAYDVAYGCGGFRQMMTKSSGSQEGSGLLYAQYQQTEEKLKEGADMPIASCQIMTYLDTQGRP